MKSYQFIFQQKLPKPLPEIWDFFSSPFNLANITPRAMTFEITSALTKNDKMYPGMLVTYKVVPIAGFKLNWITEITQVTHEKYFIDEQRFGPFKFWHHQHHFKVIDGGVEMTDILTYGLPFGIWGKMANSLFVSDKLTEIFEFRRLKAEELFGKFG